MLNGTFPSVDSVGIPSQALNTSRPCLVQYDSTLQPRALELVEGETSPPIGAINFTQLAGELGPWIDEVTFEFGEFLLVFFGSRVRGNFNDNSDLDALILYETSGLNYDENKFEAGTGYRLTATYQLQKLHNRFRKKVVPILIRHGVFIDQKTARKALGSKWCQLEKIHPGQYGIFGTAVSTKKHIEFVIPSSKQALDAYAQAPVWLHGSKQDYPN